MKKRIVLFIVVIAVLITGAVNIYGDSDLRVKVNEKVVEFPDIQPFIDENNRTQVPVRFVSEALGAKVEWNGKLRVVTIKKGTDVIVMRIGENRAVKNRTEYQLDTKVIMRFGRTFVPIRFVSEVLGAKVKWVVSTKTVDISTVREEKETEVVNGYTVPVNPLEGLSVECNDVSEDKSLPEIKITIDYIDENVEQLFDETEEILLSKFQMGLAVRIMQYARQKTSEDYDLVRKIYDIGSKKIWIEGSADGPLVISVYVK